MLLDVDHPIAGIIKLIGFPVKMSRTPCKTELPPPYLGQHTNEILKEINHSEEEINELKQMGII